MQAGKNSFEKFLREAKDTLGFCAVSALSMNSDTYPRLLERLKEAYVADGKVTHDWPGYMQRTSGKRADPRTVFPWAKSLAVISMPFNGIPINNNFLPEAAEDCIAGLVAGYAGRIDYHTFLQDNIYIFSAALKKYLGKDFRSEIFVDTKPVAEKSLAAFSGLGAIGLNSCLLCKGEGSGTCLGILAMDIDLPETEPVDFDAPCTTCGKCVERCPTGAITGKPGVFIYKKCRSYLTMEKKGVLEKDEAVLLGDWIFGCDICTSLCPGSHPMTPIKADLEWLLLEKDSIVKDVIKSTALEYPGLKLLRRNALAVLENRDSSESHELARKFSSIG
ncbi:MAG TPA: hypothetical protein DET40_12420 [Lentisphaeria bacterium]|nr:MAG: hypothetical protein A2X45_00405 [Lentisphaerae bacterium GWF2_50_93]HCE44344.1 hypothetical protein [Lentisphaeria bacterium]